MINETLSSMSEGQVVETCQVLVGTPIIIYYFVAVTLVTSLVFWFGVKGHKSKLTITKLILFSTVLNAIVATAMYFLPHAIQRINFFGGL